MSGKRRAASSEKEGASSLPTRRSPLVLFIVAAMEAVLLVLVCLSPWAYGAVHPGFEFLLDAGIAVLLALWAARMLLERQLTWKKSGVTLCLAGLFLLGVWQHTSLPRSVLAWVSPGTVPCYNQLLPEQPETLLSLSTDKTPAPAADTSAGLKPGSTISLYPGATRKDSLRLAAVLLVFAVVYNNLTSKGALIRLSVVVLINGVLLSIFALAQLFGAPPKTVYWTYPTMGEAFGPFICKNHFPDYVNICIGLGIGLLIGLDRRSHSFSSSEDEGSPMEILQNPLALWICAALGLMASAVVFSRSRGGLLALVATTLLCGALGRLRLGRSFRMGSVLLVAGIVVSLTAWFGIGLIKDRLASLSSEEAYVGRIPLWLRSLPIAGHFPIWGTGYGTFNYIEPVYRKDTRSPEILTLYGHAHNDYLEMLVEGGVVGFCLILAAVAIVVRQGYRALALNRGSRRAGLALGVLFAFTALALHCIGDFGAHIPAILLLATVVSAHLCALGQSRPHKSPHVAADDGDAYRLRLGGIAPVFGALASLGFGLVLCADGWKAHRIDRLQAVAFQSGKIDANLLHTRIACLSAAVSLGPENAPLHYELGSAHAQLGELLAGSISSDRRVILEQSRLALQEFLHARDACPLLGGPQLGIAGKALLLKTGDTAEEYLRRAKLVAPGQAAMFYLCGLQEFKSNRLEDAWASWRHCLELSDDYLSQILIQTRRLTANQLIEKILPNNPDLLIAAAVFRDPDGRALTQRRPFMEKAQQLLQSEPDGAKPRELHVRPQIQKARFEFARYLYEQGKMEEARRELRLVLAHDPKDEAAKELLNTVARRQSNRR